MTLNEAVDAYITMKRSLGAVFSTDTRILHSFARALGDIPLDTVDHQATYLFCRGSGQGVGDVRGYLAELRNQICTKMAR